MRNWLVLRALVLLSLLFLSTSVTYSQSNDDCYICHDDPGLVYEKNGVEISGHVDPARYLESVHADMACVDCHIDLIDAEIPHESNLEPVMCDMCHDAGDFYESVHGVLLSNDDPDAPTCASCHGAHDILAPSDRRARTHLLNVHEMCATCHGAEGVAWERYASDERNVVDQYLDGVHGQGLVAHGLVVTATCISCHSAHGARSADDPQSRVHRDNITAMCESCHVGIGDSFNESVHSPTVTQSAGELPICSDCHLAHDISSPETRGVQREIMTQCGDCHAEITDLYLRTVHGKRATLGGMAAAMCYDCHGFHDIRPLNDSLSRLSEANIVATCAACHEGANANFVGFIAHADRTDRERFPILFYTFWLWMALLIGEFVMAGSYTLLWIPRTLQGLFSSKRHAAVPEGTKVYQRFRRIDRLLHLMIIVSFVGLSITGMTLMWAQSTWAQWLAPFLGGPEGSALIHRVCALITFAYFAIHLGDLIATRRKRGVSWWKFIFSPNSMMFNKQDWKDLKATLKWMVFRGPMPKYGRYTYLEKHDYWAVFWGVGIIGGSGLILWFPEFFTLFFPGWVVNMAMVIHSVEALLAVGFIFSIHFFNVHFRPGKFPVDNVMFTGQMTVEELKHERAAEYEELVASGQLEERLVPALSPRRVWWMHLFGLLMFVTGIALLVMIIWSALQGLY